ncbi:hypothetical protein [Brevibacterium litoralis]|uniref:hypothetical protein n=1 Tax=Brevibacterium litoralis TaxID=3138935 RepID=UPI0032EBDF85
MDTTPVDPHADDGMEGIDSFSLVRLDAVTDMDEVLGLLDDLATTDAHGDGPGHRFLVTLDDLDQAVYTSMHAMEDERLALDDFEAPAGAEPTISSEADDVAFIEAFEHAQLAHVVAALDASENRVTWADACGRVPAETTDLETLARVNADPGLVFTGAAMIQALPADIVTRDDLVLAGLPNGYFTDDLDVFHNQAVVRTLGEEFGLRLFGIGAAYLGFVRDTPFTATEAARIADRLRELHAAAEAPGHDDLVAALTDSRTVLVGYAEDFGDLFFDAGESRR